MRKELQADFNEKYQSLNCDTSLSEACTKLKEMLPSLNEEIDSYVKTEEAIIHIGKRIFQNILMKTF